MVHERLQHSCGVLVLLPRGKPVWLVSDNRSTKKDKPGLSAKIFRRGRAVLSLAVFPNRTKTNAPSFLSIPLWF